jgi:hypothetical protein
MIAVTQDMLAAAQQALGFIVQAAQDKTQLTL